MALGKNNWNCYPRNVLRHNTADDERAFFYKENWSWCSQDLWKIPYSMTVSMISTALIKLNFNKVNFINIHPQKLMSFLTSKYHQQNDRDCLKFGCSTCTDRNITYYLHKFLYISPITVWGCCQIARITHRAPFSMWLSYRVTASVQCIHQCIALATCCQHTAIEKLRTTLVGLWNKFSALAKIIIHFASTQKFLNLVR